MKSDPGSIQRRSMKLPVVFVRALNLNMPLVVM
jgi:hypothetical protein